MKPQHPHPFRRHLLPLAVAAAGPLLVSSASAQIPINVSQIVRGSTDWLNLLNPNPATGCGTACTYATASTAGAVDSYQATPPAALTAAWPPVFGTAPPAVPVVTQALTDGVADAGYVLGSNGIGTSRLATLAFNSAIYPGGPRNLQVQTWRSGSGSVAYAYTIRISRPVVHSTVPTYLEVGLPKPARLVNLPIDQLAGGQTLLLPPKRVQSRQALDIYADGLPIYSSESNDFNPSGLAYMQSTNYVPLQWGPAMDGSRVVLFLGNLPGGFETTLSIVFRNDLRADGNCGFTKPFSQSLQTCHAQRETLGLATMQTGDFLTPLRPDIRVYTR